MSGVRIKMVSGVGNQMTDGRGQNTEDRIQRTEALEFGLPWRDDFN